MSTAATETLSMRKFCDLHQLERTKVIRWCKAENLDTSDGVDEALAQRILAHFQPLESSGSDRGIVNVPSTSIQVLPPQKKDALSNLVMATTPIVPEKVIPVLNGQCEALVDDLTIVVDAVSRLEGYIEQEERNLDERESTAHQIATAVQNIGGKVGELRQRGEAVDDRKISVANQETELKMMLGKLQAML